MSVLKITEEQKQFLLDLYNKPTSEVKTTEFPKVIKEEAGINIPYNLIGEFYQKAFNLDIKARKRKNSSLVFEIDGKTITLNSIDDEEPVEVVVEQEPVEYQPHIKEPSKFEF